MGSIILKEIEQDIIFFETIYWDENLELKIKTIMSKYYLKTLDLIQIASAILAEPDIFITSDKNMYKIADKLLKKTLFL